MKHDITIGIIGGKGRMGAYLSRFFSSLNYKVIVSDLKTKLSNRDIAQKADVIIVSVNINATEKTIKEIVPYLQKGQLLMDVTSVKENPIQAMLKAPCEVIGTHPMFDPSNGMKNQIFITCPVRAKKWYPWLLSILKKGGTLIKKLDARKHDELMTIIQGLTHFSDITLAHTLKQIGLPIKTLLQYQSPAYRIKLDMMARILNQNPNLYANIQIQNKGNIQTTKQYIRSCEQLLDIVKKQDEKAFTKYFNDASKYLGTFKKAAHDESNRFIEMLNREAKLAQKYEQPKNAQLALLGPTNSFSDLAGQKYAPDAIKCYCHSFDEVFEKIASGEISEAIVPIENSLTGPVKGILEKLYTSSKIEIAQEIKMTIEHCLASIQKMPLRKIKMVLSHEQPLMQCEKFIKKHLHHSKVIQTTSTSAAFDQVCKENLKTAAAIGTKQAAEKLGLYILDENISDNKKNWTRFIIIRKKSRKRAEIEAKKSYKTSMGIAMYKTKPGSLAEILTLFAKNNIDLSRLESRPAPNNPGNYVFFIDFLGHKDEKKMKSVLEKIDAKVAKIRIFGSYRFS